MEGRFSLAEKECDDFRVVIFFVFGSIYFIYFYRNLKCCLANIVQTFME